MTLGEKQELFMELKYKWVAKVLAIPGYKLRPGEGRINQKGADPIIGRKAMVLRTGQIVYVKDLVHKENSAHYNGLAEDPQLFVNGRHITRTDSPEWQRIGPMWEAMHPLCRWGGRFEDGNHISLEHNGVK